MFPLVILKVSMNAFSAANNDSLLWHKRFGHLNFGGLDLLCKKKMADDLSMDKIEKQPCEACIFGKYHRDKFPQGESWRASKPLMLVHDDVLRTNANTFSR